MRPSLTNDHGKTTFDIRATWSKLKRVLILGVNDTNVQLCNNYQQLKFKFWER